MSSTGRTSAGSAASHNAGRRESACRMVVSVSRLMLIIASRFASIHTRYQARCPTPSAIIATPPQCCNHIEAPLWVSWRMLRVSPHPTNPTRHSCESRNPVGQGGADQSPLPKGEGQGEGDPTHTSNHPPNHHPTPSVIPTKAAIHRHAGWAAVPSPPNLHRHSRESGNPSQPTRAHNHPPNHHPSFLRKQESTPRNSRLHTSPHHHPTPLVIPAKAGIHPKQLAPSYITAPPPTPIPTYARTQQGLGGISASPGRGC